MSHFGHIFFKLAPWSWASGKDFLKRKSLIVRDSITAKSASFLPFLIDSQSLSVNENV